MQGETQKANSPLKLRESAPENQREPGMIWFYLTEQQQQNALLKLGQICQELAKQQMNPKEPSHEH